MKPKFDNGFKPPASWHDLHFGAGNDVGVLASVNSGFRISYPKDNEEQCIRCMLCWIFCPEGCIEKTDDDLIIDLDYCKGCGICVNECPKDCFEMVKE